MGTEPETLTVAEAVRRAVEACAEGADEEPLARLVERFEDDDAPITAAQDLGARLEDARQAIDPDGNDAALSMATATALYLAFRRDMDDADDDTLLRSAARAEWDGPPPAAVADWLAGRGVRV